LIKPFVCVISKTGSLENIITGNAIDIQQISK
jgi:hypothetical protein